MKTEKQNAKKSGIIYSCYHSASRDGEHFVPEHTLSFQIAGSLVLSDGSKSYASVQDSLRLIRRNQLLKFVKHPPKEGDFKSLSIYFNQETLKEFSLHYNVFAKKAATPKPVVNIVTTPILRAYINSLLEYRSCKGLENKAVTDLKLKEGLLLVIEAHPELKNILFDFTEPHKINLEEFMMRNYHFNVNLDRFAYLTGRSLATFKRDFQHHFQESPRQWLQQKRLEQAHYLLTHEGKNANTIYLDVGFENLSHFSYAFKKRFGYAPSTLKTSHS
ncbi:AraC family transcriptional regulator [Chryseolinea sp. T2]|uniref:helix-turn-helix domain-containing protein n=1 Tax=Chryseolinea sp. T2 TaxID=3129255 RepID=UPI0030775FF2